MWPNPRAANRWLQSGWSKLCYHVRDNQAYVRMNLTYSQAVGRGLAEGAFVLKPILGSANSERVLIYILARGQGYAREIARFFNVDPDSVQKQLVKFEAGGVLITRPAGRTVLYEFNPRYPFRLELSALLSKALSFYPDSERDLLTMNRRRPRRRGKPA